MSPDATGGARFEVGVVSLFGGIVDQVLALARPRPGDQHTAGGDEHTEPAAPAWDGGRYLGARWAPAHPGRVGRAIRPWAATIHDTDMNPIARDLLGRERRSFDALVKAWQERPGEGNAAHFIIGRDPEEGVAQVVDCGRNANHAGGQPTHGWFTAGGERLHPNLVSIGIEVHCAGLLIHDGGKWRTWKRDGGRLVPIGAPIPDEEVEPDGRRADRGWHRPTAYQLRELEQLLHQLPDCPLVVPWPEGWGVQPNGEAPAWAPRRGGVAGGARRRLPLVGHVTLDPTRKTDPGVPLSSWLSALE